MDIGSYSLVVVVVAVITIASVVFCLIPPFIAFRRRHRNRVAILTLSLLLGWTFLGWVAALVWSLTDDQVAPVPPRSDPILSPSPHESDNERPDSTMPRQDQTKPNYAGIPSPTSRSRRRWALAVGAGVITVAVAGGARLLMLRKGAVSISPNAVIRDAGRLSTSPSSTEQARLLPESFTKCTLKVSMPVNFDGVHPMMLEERVCPANYYHSSSDEEPHALGLTQNPKATPATRELLIVYAKNGLRIHIKAALWAATNSSFGPLRTIKTADGHDVLVWSGGTYIPCVSCLNPNPPEFLGWLQSKSRLSWNLLEDSPNLAEQTGLLKAGEYTNFGDIEVADDGEISYNAEIYEPLDPRCCATGGSLSANLGIKDGKVYVIPGSASRQSISSQ